MCGNPVRGIRELGRWRATSKKVGYNIETCHTDKFTEVVTHQGVGEMESNQ
jgi:hypothetical protein